MREIPQSATPPPALFEKANLASGHVFRRILPPWRRVRVPWDRACSLSGYWEGTTQAACRRNPEALSDQSHSFTAFAACSAEQHSRGLARPDMGMEAT